MTSFEIKSGLESAHRDAERAGRSFGAEGCELLRVIGNAVIARPGMDGEAQDAFNRLTQLALAAKRAVDSLVRYEREEWNASRRTRGKACRTPRGHD